MNLPKYQINLIIFLNRPLLGDFDRKLVEDIDHNVLCIDRYISNLY